MMDEHHSDHQTDHKPAHNSMPEIPKVDMKNVNVGNLKGGFGDIIEILKLNKAVMAKVAGRDSEGISLALVYFAVGTIVASLGPAVFGIPLPIVGLIRIGFVSSLIGGVVAAVLGVIGLFLTNWVAESMFKGSGKFPQFFRVLGYASLLRVVEFFTIIPFLSLIVGVWLLVILYNTLTEIHKLSSTNAVLTLLVAAVLAIVIGYILTMLGLGAPGISSFSLS